MACWVASAVTCHHSRLKLKAQPLHLPFRGHNSASLSALKRTIVRTNLIMQNRFSLSHQAKHVLSLTYTLNSALGSQVQSEEGLDEEFCELVNGIELVLGEDNNSFNAYLLKAVKNNNGAAVLLLSDVFGFEDSATRDFAYRLSCNGYNVLVPDLFRGDPWSKDRPESEYEQWRAKHLAQRVASDIQTSAEWLLDEFTAVGISEKLGIIGFCFGGGKLLETLARDVQGNFGAAVCFYGTRLDATLAGDVKIPVLFIVGDNDPLCPMDTLRKTESQIQGSEVRVYGGRGHGFAHRPGSPDEDEDAEDAFAVMRNWLQKHLLPNLDVEPEG